MSEDKSLVDAMAAAMMLEISKQRRHANWRSLAVVLVFAVAMGFNFYKGNQLGVNGVKIPRGADYISIVRLRGEIQPGGASSPEMLEPSLTKAFTDEKSKGVLLIINSPGGSPVQSKEIFDILMRLKEETGKRLVVMGEDSMTSGAYMVAVAGDRVYANESSVTGSIGVINQTWGYKDLAQKLGVESRVIYSGEHKHRLDSFHDLDPDDLAKMQGTMRLIHDNFIGMVKARRGNKLHGDEAQLFSGDFWTGTQAVEFGLIDGVGDIATVMKKEFSVSNAVDFSTRPSFFSSGLGGLLSSSLDESVRGWISNAVASSSTQFQL